MSGQADSAPSLDDVAALLFENEGADAPLEDRDSPQTPTRASGPTDDVDTPPGDDPEGDETDPDATDPEGDEPEGEDDDAPSPTSGEKHKVTVKGADGADETVEVTTDELLKGYQRHADYTRKTQELGERERQAHDVVSTRLNEGRQHYMNEVAKAHQAIVMLADLKTPAQLQALAATDPGAAYAEEKRMQAVQDVLDQLENGIRAEHQQTEQQTLAQARETAAKAWTELSKDGIDQPKLVEIFTGIHSAYGVPKEKLSKATDPALIRIMRDAMQFRALQTRSKEIKPVAPKTPELPKQRQPVPAATRVNKQLDRKFASGKAGPRDLAAFLMANGG